MGIDWMALLTVTVVTLVVCVAVVTLVAAGALCLDTAHARARDGRSTWALRLGAGATFAVVGLAVLFGLWLMIPYFH
jgi:hypothetical protein